jgi:ribonuclease HII
LVAAAVLFDYDRLGLRELRLLSALNDSKQHSEEMREELYPKVLRAAAAVAVTSRCARGIDERGLHVTNLRALSDVLRRVGRPGCLALSDGFAVPDTGFEQRAVVGGDATSAAIAAASVIAKVTRDRFMRRAEERYPGGASPSTWATRPRSTGRRSSARAFPPLHRMSFASAAYQQLAL